MRIKTSKLTLEHLEDIKVFLKLENNAQVLKFAITMAINSNEEMEIIPAEDGFEIATNVLFGFENEYFTYLINELVSQYSFKEKLLALIEIGMKQLVLQITMAKNDRNIFMKNLLEQQCI